jgi:hypothetical protein
MAIIGMRILRVDGLAPSLTDVLRAVRIEEDGKVIGEGRGAI